MRLDGMESGPDRLVRRIQHKLFAGDMQSEAITRHELAELVARVNVARSLSDLPIPVKLSCFVLRAWQEAMGHVGAEPVATEA